MQRISERITRIGYFAGHSFSQVECTGSTNDDLKRLIGQGAYYNIRIAGHQTHGRGQFGRVWLSKPGESLLFSFSGDEPAQRFPLSLLTGIAVFSALKKHVHSDGLWLKWPNDIYLNSGKLGGILVEKLAIGPRPFFVVGVGLNLQTPSQINAAGLNQASLDSSALLVDILSDFAELLALEPMLLREKWTTAAGQFWRRTFKCLEVAGLNQQKQEPSSIKPIGINEDGSLQARESGRVTRIVSATLSLVEEAI